MRKLFLPLILMASLLCSCGQAGSDRTADEAIKSLEHNKKIATLYHDLDAANIEAIFQEDFKGHGENHDWNLEDHRNYLSNGRYKVDSIIQQVAEDDWVATWFIRTGDSDEGRIMVPMMQFKHLRDGKIDELWEYYNFQEDDDDEGDMEDEDEEGDED